MRLIQAQWPQAFEGFYVLFELEPSAHNALQLATTSVMCGELMRGQAWFDKAELINEEAQEMPRGRMRTNYISALERVGEFAAIVPHLAWLAEGYRSLSITDPTFLWMRGLPLFPEFLEKSLSILRHTMPDAQIHAWYLEIRDGKPGSVLTLQHCWRFIRIEPIKLSSPQSMYEC